MDFCIILDFREGAFTVARFAGSPDSEKPALIVFTTNNVWQSSAGVKAVLSQ